MEVTCLILQRRRQPPDTVRKPGWSIPETCARQFGENIRGRCFLTQGFCLRYCRAMRGAVQGRRARLPLFALFSNPNVSMFERRMIELEGAEAARRHRDRHGRGDDGHSGAAESRRSRGLPRRRCSDRARYVVEDLLAALRHYVHAGRWPRSRPMAQGDAPEHKELLFWKARPIQRSTCLTISANRRNRACGRRAADRRQCVLRRPSGRAR